MTISGISSIAAFYAQKINSKDAEIAQTPTATADVPASTEIAASTAITTPIKAYASPISLTSTFPVESLAINYDASASTTITPDNSKNDPIDPHGPVQDPDDSGDPISSPVAKPPLIKPHGPVQDPNDTGTIVLPAITGHEIPLPTGTDTPAEPTDPTPGLNDPIGTPRNPGITTTPVKPGLIAPHSPPVRLPVTEPTGPTEPIELPYNPPVLAPTDPITPDPIKPGPIAPHSPPVTSPISQNPIIKPHTPPFQPVINPKLTPINIQYNVTGVAIFDPAQSSALLDTKATN